MANDLARLSGVGKRYLEVDAVRGATATFRAGEIHAVCGENGAGKTTLLKMVAGLVLPDTGRVEVFGSDLSPPTPREAIRRGAWMVLQHLALVPVFTVLENLMLGAEPTRGFGRLDIAAARKRAAAVASDLGIDLALDARIEELGLGDRQRVELARALYHDAKLLILDEPTALSTKTEAAALYDVLRRLADAQRGVVVVTHKMDEVATYADVVTIMRKGEVLFTRALDRKKDIGPQVAEVTAAIMGSTTRKDGISVTASAETKSEIVLSVENVSFGRALDGVTLSVAAGEIVGVAGVEGNGQHELILVLAGEAHEDRGRIRRKKIHVIRPDRQSEGLVLDASLRENLVLGELDRFGTVAGLLDLAALESAAEKRLASSGVEASLDRNARTLSGGNQQKIVVARALARVDAGDVLVAAHPTRGVDVAASHEIHDRLRAAAGAGAGILVLSSNLDELRVLCTRILVLARGKIVADLPRTASDEELGAHMLGVAAKEAS